MLKLFIMAFTYSSASINHIMTHSDSGGDTATLGEYDKVSFLMWIYTIILLFYSDL